MFKSVIKEILIMLLLCVAIVLILGVIFYNYIPTNKAIPNKLAAYTTPENVKTEIEEEVEAAEKEEITYLEFLKNSQIKLLTDIQQEKQIRFLRAQV